MSQIIETPEGRFEILRPIPEREIEFIRNAQRAMAKEEIFDELLQRLEDATAELRRIFTSQAAMSEEDLTDHALVSGVVLWNCESTIAKAIGA